MKKPEKHPSPQSDVLSLNFKELIQFGLHLLNILGIALTVYGLYWGIQNQIFTSEAALRDLLNAMGPAAPFGFILIQIVQTVIPIIPAALTIPMGSMIFGMGHGFFLNFTGIMIGSVLNFILARKLGRPFVEMLVSDKQWNKYVSWLDKGRYFDRLFTFGMFFPLSPADFLCYLAGLSTISFKKYLVILSLGKPFTLFLYSYGMVELLNIFFQFLGQGGG
ncbi:MAG TPA: TVP38/TMEM64 family protein [Atopostipes sp.]|nr:TVP38/TMEM64 family protein [Atopostipes sp.]